MNGTQQLQLVPECLQSTTNFGGAIIQNVCDGTRHVIPWGTADWALGLFMCILGLGVLIIGFSMAWRIVTDW